MKHGGSILSSVVSSILLLGAVLGTASGQVTLDGILSDDDNYSTSTLVTYFNGHDDSYGDFDTQVYQTVVRYGTGTLNGDDSGTEYFFLLAEAPIQIKNMVWGEGMSDADVINYGERLNYSKATGSEELNLLDSDGGELLTVDLGSSSGSGGKKGSKGADGEVFKFIDFRDSTDYLLNNGLATTDSSSAEFRTMSYEMRFELDPVANQFLIDSLENGIDFHLSPDRSGDGLLPPLVVIPEPNVMVLIGSAGVLLLLRRRR